jgi:hypothetical protein
MNIAKFRYRELIEGLRFIASPYAVQVAALPDFVDVPGETLNATPSETWAGLAAKGLLDADQLAALRRFDADLAALDVSHEVEGPAFEAVRERARELLVKLGEAYRLPDLGHVIWVRSGLQQE